MGVFGRVSFLYKLCTDTAIWREMLSLGNGFIWGVYGYHTFCVYGYDLGVYGFFITAHKSHGVVHSFSISIAHIVRIVSIILRVYAFFSST